MLTDKIEKIQSKNHTQKRTLEWKVRKEFNIFFVIFARLMWVKLKKLCYFLLIPKQVFALLSPPRKLLLRLSGILQEVQIKEEKTPWTSWTMSILVRKRRITNTSWRTKETKWNKIRILWNLNSRADSNILEKSRMLTKEVCEKYQRDLPYSFRLPSCQQRNQLNRNLWINSINRRMNKKKVKRLLKALCFN